MGLLVILILMGGVGKSLGQTSVQNFGTATFSQTSQTGSTAIIPNPTSGTTWARAGVVVPNAPVLGVITSNPLGTTDTYVRAVASSSTSVCKFSPWVGYTGSTEFYTSMKVLFGDASAGNTGSNGIWTIYQGAGAMYSDANNFTGAQVFTGLRFIFGASGTVVLTYRGGAAFINTGLTQTTFSQGTIFTIELIGNNKTSGTINYIYNGVSQTVAVQKFDLYINGTKIGDDLAEALLPANTAIDAGTFIGISSVGNVANIFVDDVKVYNAVPAMIGSNTTDYFRSIATGNWNTPATWESSPVADFSSGVISPATISPGSSANKVTIRNGHIVTRNSSVTLNQTLTIKAGGTLTGGAPLTINQTLIVEAGATLAGTGSVAINGNVEMRGSCTNLSVTYGPGGTLIYNGIAAQTAGPEFPSTLPNLIINNSAGVDFALGLRTISGSLTVQSGNLNVISSSLMVLNGNILGTGTISTTGTGIISLFGNGTISIPALGNLDIPGGSYNITNPLTINGDLVFEDNAGNLHGAAITLTGNLYANSTGIAFAENIIMTGAFKTIGCPSPLYCEYLELNNATGFSISGSGLNVTTLKFTAGCLFQGDSYVFIYNIIGGNATNHFVMDGTGFLESQATGGVPKLFPIGISASSFDPITLTPEFLVDFKVNVKATAGAGDFTPAVNDYSKVAPRKWIISPGVFTPGNTTVQLTDGSGTFTPTTPYVIGHSDLSTWTELNATYASNTWTASTSSFSPFGVGTAEGFAPCIPATVSVNPEDQHICQQDVTSFTGAFTGTEFLVYQWEYSDDGGMNWQDVPAGDPYSGEATTTLTVSFPTMTYNGYQYRLHASNDCGDDFTTAATLTLDQFFQAWAGDDNVVCTNTYFLQGSDQGFATGTWTMTAGEGTATFDDEHMAGTNVTVSDYGVKEFTWSIVNGLCSSADATEITFNELPACSIDGPTTVCPGGISVYTAPSGMSSYTWEISGDANILDGADQESVVIQQHNICGGQFILTLTFVAPNGCSNTCTATVGINDTIPPNLYSPTDTIHFGCISAPFAGFFGDFIGASDNCGLSSTGSALTSSTDVNCSVTEVWTYTATDHCMNVTMRDVTITYTIDTLAPVFGNCPAAPIDLCNISPDADLAISDAGVVTDNCHIASLTAEGGEITSAGTCSSSQTWTVTAVDVCGNEGVCSVTYTWTMDTQAPEFTNCPSAAIDLGLDPAPITSTQAITDAGTIIESCELNTSATGGIISSGCAKSQTWTVTAEDHCGNSATCVVVYIWTVTPPEVICPPDVTVCHDIDEYTFIGADPIDGDFSGPGVSGNLFHPSSLAAGSYTITYTVTANGGCTNSCTFNVNVAPLPTVDAGDYGSACTNGPDISLLGSPTGGTWTGTGVSGNQMIGYVFHISAGTQTLTYSYTTINGCTSMDMTTIVVNTPPEIFCPDPFTVNLQDIPFTLLTGLFSNGNYSGDGISANVFSPSNAGLGTHLINHTYTDGNGCTNSCAFNLTVIPFSNEEDTSTMHWVYLPPGTNGTCVSNTDCCTNVFCYGLEYTPEFTGDLTNYTTGFLANCVAGSSPVLSNTSCIMTDNSFESDDCAGSGMVLFDDSGFDGLVPVTAGVPLIIHQVCFLAPVGATITVLEDTVTDLSAGINLAGGGFVTDYPQYDDTLIISRTPPVLPPFDSSYVECDASAIAPTPPVVSDMCGNNITPTGPVISGTYAGCEGTHVFTYTYTDCAGQSSVWKYTYIIDHITDPSEFGGPVPTSASVSGTVNAVPPTLPVVKDVCGVTLTGSLLSMVDTPDPIICAGTRVYTYRFTDCSGLNYDWVFTYTVNNHTTLTCPEPIIACITDPAFALTGESPAGGTYSGTGVSGDVMTGFMFDPATAGAGVHPITYTYTNTYNCTDICTFNITVNPESGCNVTSSMTWVFLPPGQNGSCTSNTNCCSDILCYGLQYTPGYTGALTSYTTGFFANCLTGMSPVLSNTSCVMNNNSFEIGECNLFDLVLFNSSGNSGDVPVTAGVPLIIHQVCFSVPVGSTLTVSEDEATDLATSIDLAGGGFATEFPEYSDVTITRNPPVLPADGLSTVQCLSSVVDPGAPTGIIDQCGNQLTGVLTSTVDSPDPLICEGTRTYTYSFTDCSGQISDWHYVYTIEHSTSPSEIGGTVSTSGGTVECVSAVSPPVTLPVIKDVCGNTLTPTVASPEIGGTYTGCEGTFTFTYHYFDCAGLPFSWTYTYNIDHTTSPTEVGGPVSTSGGTVECISAATPPAILPLVKDVCGNTLSPTIASPVIGGTYTGCEGTYTYTYNYNDCSGLPFSWTYTYTIDHTTNPAEVGGPVSTSGGTVECISAATPPATLPFVKDVCGNTLSPDIDSPVTGGSYSGCEGTYTYTYTYSDCSGLPFSWTYTYTIDHTTNPSEVGGPVSTTGGTVECISAATAPAILPVVKDVCGNTLSPTIASPVIGGTYMGCEGTYTYTYNYSDCSGLPFSWTYTYTIDHTTNPAEFGGPVSTTGGTVECASAATAPLTLPVVKDVCGNTLSPLPGSPLIGGTYSGCEGTYTYTYNYSDCSGLPFSWTYTYTIDHTTNPAEFGGPVSTNGGTIECASAATVPAILPVVKDVCGNTLSPTIASPLIGGTYTGCEGTYTYTYNYSDCSGLPFSWTYTYTIDHTTNPVEVGGPVSTTGGTVECVSAATAPLTLPVVKDVCGNTLTPTIASPLIGGTYTGCEGTYTYTYNYSDCSGLPFSWTYTYNIDHTTNPTEIGGPVSTSGGTVACATAATAPVILPVIKDVCGNTLTPTITSPVIGGTYTGCEGTYTYTYNYSDCSGLPFSWTYTYTIEREDFTIPPPGAATVTCPTDININLVTPPSVTDNCGNTLTPSGPTGPVNTPNPLTCGGTMTYTWTYTDCEGNTHAWNYVYTINCQSVTLKVYLEGPYDTVGDSMFTKLNTSHILPGQNTTLPFVPDTPSGQPYSGAPWNYNGTTGLMFGDPPYGTVPYPKDVVDWVLVTVRKDSIKPTANIWRCAGWVHKNGEVTFPENCPFPVIDNTSFYYIMVEHRNHLGVLTPGFPLSGAEITCGGLVLHWDFTTADSYKPPFRTGEKFMDGIWAMLAANGDQNPISHVPVINSSDYTIWRSQQNTLGYKIGDFNLNGSVNSADETAWKVNQNKTSGIIFY